MSDALKIALQKFLVDLLEAGIAGAAAAVVALPDATAKQLALAAAVGFATATIAAARRYLVAKNA